MKTTVWSLLFTLVLTIPLSAQRPTPQPSLPPMPGGPLMEKRAPDPAKWTIERVSAKAVGNEAKPAAGASGKPAAPKSSFNSRVVITKTGPLTLRQTLDEQGQTWNTWCVGVVQITVWPDGKNLLLQTPNPDPTVPTPNYEDYAKSDFPGFEWLAVDKYAGLQKVRGRECILFKTSRKLSEDDPEPTDFVAGIDSDTRLPTFLRVGEQTHNYTFLPPPENPLTLPANVQEALDKQQQNRQASTRRPIRPY